MPEVRDNRSSPSESIVVVVDKAPADIYSVRSHRSSFSSKEVDSNELDHGDRAQSSFEIRLPEPQPAPPKSWTAVRDVKSGSSINREPKEDVNGKTPLKDQNPVAEDATPLNRGRKRKALTEEDRQRANLMRRLGACDSCRRRKLACSPSHDRGDGGDTLRLALAKYQNASEHRDAPPKRIARLTSPEREVISDSTATSLYEEPASHRNARTRAVSTRSAEFYPTDRSHMHMREQAAFIDTSMIDDPELRKQDKELKSFGKSLNKAASTIFPIKSASKYTSTHVLLLHWQDDDLGVAQEAQALADVFADCYNFEVSIQLIPSDSPSRWLSRKIVNFIEIDDDSPQTLKIVWYGGHSFISESNQCMWSNTVQFNSTVSWQGSQSLLEEAQSDVLVFLDACGAGNSSTIATGSGVTEVITAGGWNGGSIPDVGPFSFTTALTTQLQILSARPSFTVDQLYHHMLAGIQSQLVSDDPKQRHPTPYHFISRKHASLTQSITLSPLNNAPRTQNGEDSQSTALPPDLLLPALSMSIRFKEPQQGHFLNDNLFIEWLRMMPLPADRVTIEAGYTELEN